MRVLTVSLLICSLWARKSAGIVVVCLKRRTGQDMYQPTNVENTQLNKRVQGLDTLLPSCPYGLFLLVTS